MCRCTVLQTHYVKRVNDRAKSTPTVEVSSKGLSVGFDIAGPFEEGVAKEKWILKLNDVNFGLPWAEPMKDKSSSSVLVALQEGIYRMRQMACASDENIKVVRLHADDDSSFGAEVYAWIQDKNYLKTKTGGYDHDGNAAAERLIKAMRGHNRTLLLEAAGGKLQYRELTVQAGLHSTRLVNYLPQAGKLSPVQRAGGVQINAASVLQVFGCKTIVYNPEERRQGAEQETTRKCLYLGMAKEVASGYKLLQ